MAVNEDLAPDTHTPIAIDGRSSACGAACTASTLPPGSKPIWQSDDKAYSEYAAIIGCKDRVLVISRHGELLLLDVSGDQYRLICASGLCRRPGVLSIRHLSVIICISAAAKR